MLLIPKIELTEQDGKLFIDCFLRTLNVSSQFSNIDNITSITIQGVELKPNVDNTHWFAEVGYKRLAKYKNLGIVIKVGNTEYNYTTTNHWSHK